MGIPWRLSAVLLATIAPVLPSSVPSMRAASPGQDFSFSSSMEKNFGEELLPFAYKEPREAPSAPVGQCANLGRMSVPKADPFARKESSEEENQQQDLAEQNIFPEKYARRFEKIATRGALANVTDLQLPEPGTRWAKGIEAVPEEPPKSPLTILNRKLRLEARKFRPADETYPDKNAERQRKRIVRKAMTELYNMLSKKQWAEEQKQIEAKKQEALMGPPGLKSLGWKGDKRFKVPDPEQEQEEKKQKPRRKRKPADEVIRRWNELMRDDSIVRKMEKANKKTGKFLKWFNSATTKWARRADRRRAQGLPADSGLSDEDEDREGSEEQGDNGDAEHDEEDGRMRGDSDAGSEDPSDGMQDDSGDGSVSGEAHGRSGTGSSAQEDASQVSGTDGGESGSGSDTGASEGSEEIAD